jgi:hypothetical protein
MGPIRAIAVASAPRESVWELELARLVRRRGSSAGAPGAGAQGAGAPRGRRTEGPRRRTRGHSATPRAHAASPGTPASARLVAQARYSRFVSRNARTASATCW